MEKQPLFISDGELFCWNIFSQTARQAITFFFFFLQILVLIDLKKLVIEQFYEEKHYQQLIYNLFLRTISIRTKSKTLNV